MAKIGDENGKAIAWEKAFIKLAKVLPLNSFIALNFFYMILKCLFYEDPR